MTVVVTTEDGYRCARCTMTYRIAGKPWKASVARCPECQMVFWHGCSGKDGGRVSVGVEPGELVA
jgi:uncharacterized C2H2 Zn-finger protein